MSWSFSGDKPIYSQLVDILELKIVNGEYPPGSKLPAVRELADGAAVNPNTMQRALTELERRELVFSQRTSGRFVTESAQRVDALRHEIAEAKTSQFLLSMFSLGFGGPEIVSLITDVANKISEEVK